MTLVKPGLCFKESFGKNFFRLAGHSIREAIKQLAASPLAAANVHQARLQFKRARALVRMARFGLDKEDSQRLNHFFRDQGKALSSLRDLEVMLNVLKTILIEIPAGEEHSLLTHFRARLMDQRKKLQKNDHEDKARKEVIHRLTRMQREIASLEPLGGSPGAFLTGVRVGFDACRKRFHDLRNHPNDQALHNWRKQVKFLWYQMELLAGLWPVRFNAWISDLKTLSQGLGRHHDLVLLETALLAFLENETEKKLTLTLAKIREEKESLTTETLSLGRKFFAAKGTCLYRQLEACLEVVNQVE